MKNKPQRHKESNAFRFKTFGERINEIDLRRSALYRIRHRNENTDDDVDALGTEFHHTHVKWMVLNLTEEYNAFQKEFRGIVTLPQLLMKKEFVINTLIGALEKATVLSMQPLLEYLTALARDLREEFYAYFVSAERPILSILIDLLNTKEPDQLEWTLVCLAHLFKILKPYLKNDFSAVFAAILLLLDSRHAEHITNFAVECFAFVARDIADKEKFLATILTKLCGKMRANECDVQAQQRGCGQLLFEVIRGVNGHFHSCADSYLRVYIELLWKLNVEKSNILFDILSHMLNVLFQYIAPANIQMLWDAFYHGFAQFKHSDNNATNNSAAFEKLLTLMGQTIETKDGRFVTNPTQLVSELTKVIDTSEMNDECLQCIGNLVTALLLAKNLVLTQLDASRITKKVLAIPSTNVFEAFVWNCVKYPQFEVLILPEFLRYAESEHFGMSCLELMAKIVLHKAPLSGDGFTIENRKTYPIRLRTGKCMEKITATLNVSDNIENLFKNPYEFLLALIIYPHIIGIEVAPILEKIGEHINACLNVLQPTNGSEPSATEVDDSNTRIQNQRIIFMLSILIETQIRLREIQETATKERTNNVTVGLMKMVEILLPFCSCEYFRYIHALRVLDLIVTFESQQPKTARSPEFTIDLFKTIHSELADNLSSQYQIVRRITAHLLNRFSEVLSSNGTEITIYGVFFDIESIDANIQTYREQLLFLQRIEPNAKFIAALSNVHEPMKFDPLKFLLGLLHVNFTLLWKPITELIAAYFGELNMEDFWSLYKMKIDEVTSLQRRSQVDDICVDDQFIDVQTCIFDLYTQVWLKYERPIDLVNYRILLWRNIPSLGMLREIKNREIVTIFLDFIEHEYKRTIDRDTLTFVAQRKRRLKKRTKTLRLDDGPYNENANYDDGDGDGDDDDSDEQITDDQHLPAGTQRTLVNMLQVFVNQNNPKQLHREPELWNLYMELLSHRNVDVQKLALDCVAAYKHKYLQPYMDFLRDLSDDAKFKAAIVHFKIDKESGIVQEEHRANLMPIVMRILYSKMLTRVGGQKTSNQTRKSLVMRFLGGCHEDEILLILHMSFWMFEIEFKNDAHEMCMNVFSKINVGTVLAPNILQSSLDLLDVIQSEFSGLMSSKFLRYMINVLLIIGSTVLSVIEQSHQENSKFTSELAKPFKNLRNNCYQNLHRFFDHFENYQWSNNEIDAIFSVFIEPSAHKLTQESLMSATPLLKLFTTFGKYPKLFVLLTRRIHINNINTDTTPLRYVMDLLVEPKARPLVCLSIMEMIQNLLTLSSSSGEDVTVATPLEISHCNEIDDKILAHIPNGDTLNYGSKILLSHLPKILQRFRMVLKVRRGLTKRDLSILSKITGLITDAETSKTLLTVLLPILVRKSGSNLGEEVLTQMINTIINLFRRIEHPEHHIRSIAPMFEQITAVGPRKLLCRLLQIISDRCGYDTIEEKTQLQETVRICVDLNAFDRRWIEQPDYAKRLEAYKRIGQLTASNAIDLNAGLLIVYHSFNFIKYDKDMALRDSASFHLKAMLPVLIRKLKATKPQELDYLIGTVILNIVRRTFRDKNENVRMEGIQLLGEIARECPDAHPVLFDLNALTCKQDREIDFFDNMTHLQVQRHGKALLRFGSVAKTLECAPNPRTLTQFILPLASAYIANEKYAMHHGLITSAIETIGAVCHLLPWHQYETILKYYIKSMRFNVQYQKQMVRIVMHILDAFHFDLSKAANGSNSSKNPITEKHEHFHPDAETDKSTIKLTNNGISEDQSQNETNDGKDAEDVIVAIDNEHEDFYDQLNELNEQNSNGNDDDNDCAAVPMKKARVCVYDQPTVLSQSIAKKVVQNLATGLIPTLNHSITALSTYESFHKINKKKRRSEREEEEILRVPIALAVVKLLQKLPPSLLEQNIAGILIKVCMFLKSPLISVRMTTRDILKNIMVTIGAEHLEFLLSHLTALLTRGFQVHVLTITVHALLDALKTALKHGIMDKCLQYVLKVCLSDIFGQSGEEKLVSKIGKHTPEAKPHNKSFLSLSICASNVTQTCLLDMLTPFRDQLNRSQSKKNVIRVQECFQKIVAGLITNKQISIETILMFIYGVISESIPDLMPELPQPKLSDIQKSKIRQQRPDCFLIPVDPVVQARSNAVKMAVVTNVRANAHVLIEFGLELLQLTLKRGKLLKITYQPFVDPIVPILNDSIGSSHVRVTTFALKCISTIISKQMSLKRLDATISTIVEKIFNILHKYVAANTDMLIENFLLVQSAFKTIVNILRYLPADVFTLTEDQLNTLLFYIEQYLNVTETAKQTISFSLLKVIISRRLVTKELNNVLMQVGRLAIQSESEIARGESKGIIVNYLMEYPLGKKIEGFIEFFVSNLNYELQSGRESAITILHSIAKRFPPKYLNRKAALIFVAGGSRLVNDESAECRQHVAECLETLLNRIDASQRDELFAIVMTLLRDKRSGHREMAALLCTRFINAEHKKFTTRIESVLPVLVTTLCSSSTGKYVRISNECNDDSDDNENDDDDVNDDQNKQEEIQRMHDHQTIQLQNTIMKIIESFADVIETYSQYIDELAYESQKLLAHEHVWVRMNALKTLNIILQQMDADEIQNIFVNNISSEKSLNYIYSNPEQNLKSLTLDLCAQLIPEQIDSEMAQEVTTILLLVANFVKDIPYGDMVDRDNGEETEPKMDRRQINLPWLLRRVRYVLHAEVAKVPQSTILRTSIFKWIEGLVTLITTEQVEKFAFTLLTPLVREMSEEDQNIDARLRKLACRVGDAIRNQIGDDEYNLIRAKIQKKFLLKRAERKKLAAIEKISHPVQAAIRKKGILNRKKLSKRKNSDPLKIHMKTKKKKKDLFD